MTTSIHRRKPAIGFLAALVSVSAIAADIVHTPYAAFLDFVKEVQAGTRAYSNGSQVDENGGIWTYGHRATATTEGLTLFNATDGLYKRANSEMYGLAKFPKSASFYPYVIINPTDAAVADSGSNPRRNVQPGTEFLVQPGAPDAKTDGTHGVPVIRFTAPRTASYSVTATCEPLGTGKVGDKTSFHLLVKGALVEEVDILHGPNVTTVNPHTFAYSGITLFQGETIELVVGPGIGDNDPSQDSSSVKIAVTEHTDVVYSFGEDMAANINAGNQDNPFCGGRWLVGYCTRNANDPFANNAAYTPLKWGFLRDANFVGYNELGNTSKDCVYCCVNITDQPKTSIVALDPGEIFTLAMSKQNAAFRFVTPKDGTWKVTAKVRNLQASKSTAECGIDVSCLAGGHRLFFERLATPGKTVSATASEYTSFLKAGAFIDLVIDSRGSSDSDSTGLKFYVEKVADSACPYSDAGHAFNVEMAKKENATNPFVDADGVKWEAGQTTGAEGAFSTLPFYKEDKPGYTAGWMPGPTDSVRLPRLQANYNCSLQSGDKVGFNDIIPLYDDQFYLHPQNNGYGVLRYYAPSTGVYRVTSVFRDANATTDKADGVDCHIRANEHVLVSGHASYFSTNKVGGGSVLIKRDVAFLEPRNIYLAKGEPLDFSVGITRTAQSDATAVAGTVRGTGLAEDSYVNVDFKASAGAAFTGRGRIGWAEPRWNAMVVGGTEASKQNLRMADGARSTVTLAITHGGAAIVMGSRTSDVALLTSGIRSENTGDVYTFTLGGLTPQTTYRLCLYGRAIDQNQSRPQFTVGSTTTYADGTWFQKGIADLGIIDAKADANGEIIGTFKSSGQTTVDFFGLQVGGTFEAAPPTGMFILIK